jgi:hypothetical protein
VLATEGVMRAVELPPEDSPYALDAVGVYHAVNELFGAVVY